MSAGDKEGGKEGGREGGEGKVGWSDLMGSKRLVLYFLEYDCMNVFGCLGCGPLWQEGTG
jgi:hypothetical protein